MGSLLRTTALATACTLAAAGVATAATVPAFAAGGTPTTLTVTSNRASVASGQPVSFIAQIAPSAVGTVRIGGGVTWSVTGADHTTVPCATVKALTTGGRARCTVGPGSLLAGASPYTAVATYAGDATFAAASGSADVAVTPASTHVRIALDALPANGAPTTVTATVIGGPASAHIAGNLTFSISSQTSQSGFAMCTGPASNPRSPSNDVKAMVGGVAVCDLPAGWMTVPKASLGNPRPTDGWSIHVFYPGSASFASSVKFTHGVAR